MAIRYLLVHDVSAQDIFDTGINRCALMRYYMGEQQRHARLGCDIRKTECGMTTDIVGIQVNQQSKKAAFSF